MKVSFRSIGILCFIAAIAALVMISHPSHFLADANDALVTAQVKGAFFFHPHTSSKAIHVETNQGNVVLKGIVNDQKEIQLAKFISRTTPGVTSVNTQHLKVKNSLT